MKKKQWERNELLAQSSLKQRINKAMCMKITCVWWRLMKIHFKIMVLVY